MNCEVLEESLIEGLDIFKVTKGAKHKSKAFCWVCCSFNSERMCNIKRVFDPWCGNRFSGRRSSGKPKFW